MKFFQFKKRVSEKKWETITIIRTVYLTGDDVVFTNIMMIPMAQVFLMREPAMYVFVSIVPKESDGHGILGTNLRDRLAPHTEKSLAICHTVATEYMYTRQYRLRHPMKILLHRISNLPRHPMKIL